MDNVSYLGVKRAVKYSKILMNIQCIILGCKMGSEIFKDFNECTMYHTWYLGVKRAVKYSKILMNGQCIIPGRKTGSEIFKDFNEYTMYHTWV